MGRASKSVARSTADSKVAEFVEAAAVGDLRMVKKMVKSAKVEIDDGELALQNEQRTERGALLAALLCAGSQSRLSQDS